MQRIACSTTADVRLGERCDRGRAALLAPGLHALLDQRVELRLLDELHVMRELGSTLKLGYIMGFGWISRACLAVAAGAHLVSALVLRRSVLTERIAALAS